MTTIDSMIAGLLTYGHDSPPIFLVLPGYLITVFGLLLLVIWSRWKRQQRADRAMMLLGHIKLAVEMNLPLPATLAGAERGEPPVMRRMLTALREQIEVGEPIGRSLAAATPDLPPHVLDSVIAAEKNGTLPLALRRVTDEHRRHRGYESAGFASDRAYAVVVFITMLLVVSLLMVLVYPKFAQIFKDFQIAPPIILLWLYAFTRDYMPLALATLAALMLYGVLVDALRSLFWRRRNKTIFTRMHDAILWKLPVVHAVIRDRGLAESYDALADGLDRGRPAADALQLAILPNANVMLNRRLRRWQAGVAAGAPLHQAAADAGLPRLTAALLAPGPYSDGTTQALRFLARYYRDRHERLLLVLRAAFSPLVTLVLASMVFFVVLAIFGSMVSLIQSVSSS